MSEGFTAQKAGAQDEAVPRYLQLHFLICKITCWIISKVFLVATFYDSTKFIAYIILYIHIRTYQLKGKTNSRKL